MMRPSRFWRAAMALCGMTLTACGDKQGSVEAARALAETLYPGQLEMIEAHPRDTRYAVIFRIKGLPYSHVELLVDRDPAQCRPDTRCALRLRQAYESGKLAGQRLAALAEALPRCGVPMLGVHEGAVTPAHRVVVELPLDVEDQQPGLDRLTPCIAAARAQVGAEDARQWYIALRILLPRAGQATRPGAPAAYERWNDPKRQDEPSYMIALAPQDTHFSAEKLTLYANDFSDLKIREKMGDAARQALADQRIEGHVPHHIRIPETKLDPRRLDIVRAYVLACSVHEAGKGPCKTDIAIPLRHDLRTGAITALPIVAPLPDDGGPLRLPELAGR